MYLADILLITAVVCQAITTFFLVMYYTSKTKTYLNIAAGLCLIGLIADLCANYILCKKETIILDWALISFGTLIILYKKKYG